MMTQAFYTGVSGLKSNQTAIDIVSDNLANISTNGFRSYNAEFASLFEEKLNAASAGSPVQSGVGVGSRVLATTMNMLNGSLTLSDRSTDLAINGDGWFGVQAPSGQALYTRDGAFTFDANANLVTNDGYFVLGTMGGNISNEVLTSTLNSVALKDVGAQDKLQFPKFLTYPPEVSTTAKFFANIGVGDYAVTVAAGVVDPQGLKNNLRLDFVKNEVQVLPGSQWTVTATTKSLDGSTVYDTKTGAIEFGANGNLTSSTLTSIDNNGASVAIDLGSGYDGIFSINRIYQPGSTTADGSVGGDLNGYEISQSGEVVATFTNGKQSSVGKIAVYHFQNDQGLDRVSGSRFAQSDNSGNALFFKNANGENILGASLLNFKLEASNVRMDTALTELIIYQKAYDASSKCVTTADQMIQKALSMHK